MNPTDIIRIYNTRYQIAFSGATYEKSIRRDASIVKYLLSNLHERSICDVCCGRGMHVTQFAKFLGCKVVGVDSSSCAERYFLASDGATDDRTSFICSDITDYANSTSVQYDATVCYLPHLDSRFESQDTKLFKSMWKLCSSDGIAVVSFLCQEYATRLVGVYNVNYDPSESISTTSRVEYSPLTKILKISQTGPMWNGELIEEMSLYRIQDIKELLMSVGFRTVSELSDQIDMSPMADAQRVEESKITLIALK